MTEKQVLLVKHSWSYVAGNIEDATIALGRNLGKISPELKSFVQKNLENEKLKDILITVTYFVAALPDLKKVEEKILNLLTFFVDQGITRDYYHAIIQAFLLTMEKKINKTWTLEIREAWIQSIADMHAQLLEQRKPLQVSEQKID